MQIKIRTLRSGSFFPVLLERRRRIDRALHAVIMDASALWCPPRSVDDLVKALGVDTEISKSEASRICGALDTEIKRFRERLLAHTQFAYVFADAHQLLEPAAGLPSDRRCAIDPRFRCEKLCVVSSSPVPNLAARASVTDATLRRCVWCSSDEEVIDLRNEPRCRRCRAAEQTIAEARAFIAFYGLRPLGGSLESDDEEEREHRVAAREASAELTNTRTHTPTRRTSQTGRSAAVARPAATATRADARGAVGAARPAKSDAARRPDVSRPGQAELASRAEGLLTQLTELEERLAVAKLDSGLSGKAKVSELTAKRESVLRTLAALEKAKRALEPA